MKNLLFIFFLALPLTNLYAQDITDDGKDISIELTGGITWVETDFNINIEKKGTVVFIKYRMREDIDPKTLKSDSIFNRLKTKYNLGTSEEKKILAEKLVKMMHQHRITYQDSIMVNTDHYMAYKPFLKYLANANEEAFNGGPFVVFDAAFIVCKITYQGKTKKIVKSTPLSIDSPLLYAFLKETLKIGDKAQLKSVSKIEEVFEYLF
jgi:hypothetical protein